MYSIYIKYAHSLFIKNIFFFIYTKYVFFIYKIYLAILPVYQSQNIYFQPQHNFEKAEEKHGRKVGWWGGGDVGVEGRQNMNLQVTSYILQTSGISMWSGCIFEIHLVIQTIK